LVIKKAINNFWDNNIINLIDDKHIIVLFRVVYNKGIYNTLELLKKLNKEDKIYYINYINGILFIKSNKYKEQEIIKIIVSFKVRNGKTIIKKNKNDHQFNPKIILYQNYKHYNLSVTLNHLNYRTLIHFYKSKNIYLV